MQYFKNNTFLFIFLYIVTFLLFVVTRVQSQPYFFRHYQVESGLSNNTVFCSVQDKDGFLWFGTKDGLDRFDGYHFKHFTINDEGHTLTPDIISCMLTDSKGTLFIGCQKGLYYFDKEKECLIRLIDSFVWINAIHFDNQGQLWFISAVRLEKLLRRHGRAVRMPKTCHRHMLDVAVLAVRQFHFHLSRLPLAHAWSLPAYRARRLLTFTGRFATKVARERRLLQTHTRVAATFSASLQLHRFAIPLRVAEMMVRLYEVVDREVVLAIKQSRSPTDNLLEFDHRLDRS